MDEDGAAAVENKLLKSQIAVLEQRVEVYEKSVLEKTDELYAEITKRKLVEEEIKRKRSIYGIHCSRLCGSIFCHQSRT